MNDTPAAAGAGPGVREDLGSVDWSGSPLGPPSLWSTSLRSLVATLLKAKAQIVLFWGPEFAAIYNDAYAPTIGSKHPRALGRPARENWAELWDDLGPLLDGVIATGETFQADDREFYIERFGYGEQVFFDVSYSLVPDDDGGAGGVLCIVTETTQRVLAERALKRSEAKLSTFIKAANDMVYSMSPDWSTMHMLEGQGILADTMDPLGPWREAYILPEDAGLIEDKIAEAVATKSMFRLEHRVRLIGGEIGWIQSRALPVFDETGEIVEWFGTATDVTERRAREEHLELLVNELNHRVKNNLAMVQAMALRSFQPGIESADAARRFSDRIAALADATDLVTGERRAGASLCEAIDRAVASHAPSPQRIAIDCDDVVLTPKTALAFSLAIHELCTNAVKHGAWSGPRGEVRIETRARREESEIALTFSWIESGGPTVAPPVRSGFGSRLIERGLAAEMNGKVELRFRPPGVVCEVSARLPVLED